MWVVEPQKPDHKNKWDFNDALLSGGVQRVQQDLAKATLSQKSVNKDKFNVAIEKTLLAASESTLAQGIESSHQTHPSIEIQNQSLKEILTRYVDMELEQTRLVNAMHSTRLQDPKASKIASAQILKHTSAIQTFAEQAIQHPEIKTILEAKQKTKPPHIANRGGFIGICERLQQGEWSEEDIHLLVKQLRNKVASEALSQMRERNRSNRLR